MLGQGLFDELEQMIELQLRRKRFEPDRDVLRGPIRRRNGFRRGGDGDPAPGLAAVIAQFGEVLCPAFINIDEPIPGFRVNMDFVAGLFAVRIFVEAQRQVTLGRKRIIVFALLLGEVPMRIKPVWIACR